MKLYTNSIANLPSWFPMIVAEMTQGNVETVIVSQEQQDTAEFKAKRCHGKFPMLEIEDGRMLYESAAIAEYIARNSAHSGALVGRTAMEQAQIS
jgi:glutathione S-transferase